MQTPILMIHGMCCTGDVWAHFRRFFEARGARVYTPTLCATQRVSITARPPRGLRDLSLNDYVRELETEVERIEQETGRVPAIIGHSMGGLLAQALAERNRVRAAVFISPAAPAGIHTPLTRMFWGALLMAKRFGLSQAMIKPDRRTVFPMVLNAMPKAERLAALEAMVWESGRVFEEFASYPIDETKVRIPVLTVAGARDRLVAAPLVRLTAKKYQRIGGDFIEYSDHGHWLYAEPGWETPAKDIYAWLERAFERSAVPALSERPRAHA
jgi:alpha-beta hydrolase superfamily lysophospholipase